MQSPTIFTLGYSGWTVEAIEAEVARLDAILIDVRMVPRSRFAPWNGSAFKAKFGERYLWLREFGNVNYKGTFDQIKIADFPTGLKRLSELTGQPFSGKAVILMCGCADVNNCHRKVLAERLAGLWSAAVVHLAPPPKTKKAQHAKPPGMLF